MERKIATFKRIFGSGPIGLVISLVLLFLAGWINTQIVLPSLSDNRLFLDALFMATGCVTLIIIVWSLKSLPAADRATSSAPPVRSGISVIPSMPHFYPYSTSGWRSGSTVTFLSCGHCSSIRYGIIW